MLLLQTPSSIGKNLTEAQIAAAKNRMVGRAPPGVASRPSKDGFRASEPMANKIKKEIKSGEQPSKINPHASKQKAKVIL